MAAFGSNFDLPSFKLAFDTRADMEAYNRVQALERAALRVQNYLGELAISGTKLAGLQVSARGEEGSATERAFAGLRDAGVIDATLCARLVQAQGARRRIEHNYVRVNAGDVHRAAVLIHRAAADFISRYRPWIRDQLADG